jgi:hypothetical protein
MKFVPALQAYKDDLGFSTYKRLHGKVPLSLAQRHLGFLEVQGNEEGLQILIDILTKDGYFNV